MTIASIGEALAHGNAILNATSATLVLAGVAAIRAGKRDVHRRRMQTAFLVSAAFLASYLTRAALTGVHRFPVEGWIKTAYLTLLGSHTILAAICLPLVLRTLWLGRKGRYEQHRKIARWTYPIWAYVSVTGVIIYGMLYHLGPALAERAGL
jgi:putative membrane protein